MRICAVVKYPPIQGGVSARSYWLARSLAEAGHQVHVITNADDVEDTYRIWIPEQDRDRLECSFPNGGLVRVSSTWSTGSPSNQQIPSSDLFVTKLAAMAADAVRAGSCDLIYSYYFEPYAMAGHLAASWTGVPHVVEHAGSDRSHLLASPDLGTAYREILRAADAVVSVPGSIENLGVEPARTHGVVSGFLPEEWAEPDGVSDAEAVDAVDALIKLIGSDHPHITNTRPLPQDRPTFLIYGKVGEYEGSYELLEALAGLRDHDQEFNLVLVGGGAERERFLRKVEASGLSSCTWTLPFIPHWRIPQLLRAVTAVCCLERDFPIEVHEPVVAREVLAAGTCLVTSRELLDKSQFRTKLQPGTNVLVVEDPQNVDELREVLAAVIRDPQGARSLGVAGRHIPDLVHGPELASAYTDVFQRVLDRQPSRAFEASLPVTVTERIAMAMPAAAAALGSAFEGIVQRLHGDSDSVYDQADELCRVLLQEGAEFGAPVLEIADFERNTLWTRSPFGTDGSSLPFPMRDAQAMRLSSPRSLKNSFPVASGWLRVERYRPDIVDIIRARPSAQEIQPGELPMTPYLFVKRGDLLGRVLSVSEGAVALLAACDGSASAAEIIDKYADGDAGSKDAAHRLLRSLVAQGAVRL